MGCRSTGSAHCALYCIHSAHCVWLTDHSNNKESAVLFVIRGHGQLVWNAYLTGSVMSQGISASLTHK